MPRFGALDRVVQQAIFDDPRNLIPTTPSENSSRKERTYAEYDRRMTDGAKLDPEYRQRHIQQENQTYRELQQTIDDEYRKKFPGEPIEPDTPEPGTQGDCPPSGSPTPTRPDEGAQDPAEAQSAPVRQTPPGGVQAPKAIANEAPQEELPRTLVPQTEPHRTAPLAQVPDVPENPNLPRVPIPRVPAPPRAPVPPVPRPPVPAQPTPSILSRLGQLGGALVREFRDVPDDFDPTTLDLTQIYAVSWINAQGCAIDVTNSQESTAAWYWYDSILEPFDDYWDQIDYDLWLALQ